MNLNTNGHANHLTLHMLLNLKNKTLNMGNTGSCHVLVFQRVDAI